MTVDALDPDPDGDYPHLPRLPDGTLDTERMPIGRHTQRSLDGQVHTINATPGIPGGRTILDVIDAAPAGCRCSAHQ